MSHHNLFRNAGVSMLCLIAGAVLPADRAAAQDATFSDAAAQPLQAMAQAFAEAQTFAVDIELDSTMSVGDRRQSDSTRARFLVKRPDKYRIEFKSGGSEGLVVADGRTQTVVHRAWSQYTSKAVDSNRPFDHQMLDLLLARTLVAEDPYDALKQMSEGARHVGREQVDDRPADHLVLNLDAGELHLWVAQEAPRVPLKLRIEQTVNLRGGATGSMRTEIGFRAWQLDADAPDDAFDFEPDEDMTRVDQFQAPSPDVLIGKPAPDFKLQTPDGRTVELSEHKGEDVVILDFWATWCGPCIRGLPVVQGVYDRYAKRDIAFYAVNLRESAEKVRGFEKQHGMDLPVLLDRDGSVAEAYFVKAIPQTVIIGKDGKVRAVHTGITADTEAKLNREVKALLEGRKLK